MKSKICLCNGAVLKKDLTRFLPLMLGTGLLLWFTGWSVTMTYDLAYEEFGATSFGVEPVQIFLLFTHLLGLVSALCLFGYLTKKRECDAMHALPVRRETFFFTHCIAALLFFVIPFGILYAFMPGERGWVFQMGFTLCGWLFSFGLAVFAMMLAGRRLGGMMIFYLIGNLASSVYTMIDSIYIPQLPGLYLESELVLTLTPTTHMATLDFAEYPFSALILPMGLYALGGVILLALSLLIYRKRKLERSGDFLAERWLEPVFAWGLGIWAACIFVSLGYTVGASVWVPLILGLTVGYFAARMLFARSVRVFGKQSLIGFAALVAVMAASVSIVSMDPLGLVQKVPEPGKIESVVLSDSMAYNYGDWVGTCDTTDPEQIETIRSIHQEIVTGEEISMPSVLDDSFYLRNEQFYLIYRLTDGSELKRAYWIEDEEHLDQIEHLMSQPEHLLGTADIEELLDCAWDLNAIGMGTDRIHTRKAFFTVFLADCEAGNMYSATAEDMSIWSISVRIDAEDGSSSYVYIDIPAKAEATVAWLEEHFG